MSRARSPVKVLVTTDAVGGVWSYALDLSRGLAARGDAVTLAVLGPPPSAAQRRQARGVDGLTLDETGLALDWTAADAAVLARSAHELSDLAERVSPDVVHLNSPALAGGVPWPAPIVGVAHSCAATWWSALRRGSPPADLGWRIQATARGYAACQAVIAPSASFAAATLDAYGVQPLVIRNGRDGPVFPARTRRDIPVLTTGRLWDEGKDAATLDAAAAVLDAPVLALGPLQGPEGGAVAFFHLRTPGRRTARQVAATLARARVFVSTARYEPFGLSVLEAAQAGCALVLSDIPTFRELWDGAAAFAPAGDAPAFAAALRALLADDAGRESLAASARVRAERYSLGAMVRATAAVHRTVLRAEAGVAA